MLREEVKSLSVLFNKISPTKPILIWFFRALSAIAQSQPNLMSEVVYHASLGGNHQLTASAAVMAVEHSLRLFAYTERSH